MPEFSINCRRCGRLARFLERVRVAHPDYHACPVAPFGAARPRLLIVGLAPGMHGANRTGRPFTGDFAGVLLYDTLHRYGFANRPVSTDAADGLKLKDCRITNAVKCLPPANKPLPDEVRRCNDYLAAEIHALPEGASIPRTDSATEPSIRCRVEWRSTIAITAAAIIRRPGVLLRTCSGVYSMRFAKTWPDCASARAASNDR